MATQKTNGVVVGVAKRPKGEYTGYHSFRNGATFTYVYKKIERDRSVVGPIDL